MDVENIKIRQQLGWYHNVVFWIWTKIKQITELMQETCNRKRKKAEMFETLLNFLGIAS